MQVRKVARVLPPLPSPPFFFPYSSLTFVCGAKCPFLCHWSTSFQWSFFLPTSISACDPSITPPDGGYIVYVPVTKEEKLTKKGCPELWKQHRSGLPLALNGVSTSRRIGARRQMCVCLSVTKPGSPSASPPPTHPARLLCQTEAPDRSRGSWVGPWKIWL